MTDDDDLDETGPEGGLDDSGAEEGGGRRGQKKQRSGERAERGYSGIALRELRRARRFVEQAPDAATLSAEASMALQIANTLALLDLADALREKSAGRAADE